MSYALVLTTDCIFRCTYCFQLEDRDKLGREQRKMSRADVDDFFAHYVKDDSAISLMGGEPFLCLDLIEYIVTKGYKVDRDLCYSVITNGAMLNNPYQWQKFLDFFRRVIQPRGVGFYVNVSYDGSGQCERVFKNGSPTAKIVEGVLDKFLASAVPVGVMYTIHDINYPNFVRDVVYILERFRGVREIKFNVAYRRMTERLGVTDVSHLLAPLAHLESRYDVRLYFESGLKAGSTSTSSYKIPGVSGVRQYEASDWDLFSRT